MSAKDQKLKYHFLRTAIVLFVIWTAVTTTVVHAEDLCRPLVSQTSIETETPQAGELPFVTTETQLYERVRDMVDPNETRPLLSLVIPAYKEERRLPGSLKIIQQFFNTYPLPVEVLVMVERSPDRTLALAREAVQGDARIRVVDNQVHRGKGYAVRSGMQQARGIYSLFMDADLAVNPIEVLRFLDHFRERPQVDIIIASREGQHDSSKPKRTALRGAMSWGFRQMTTRLVSQNVTDTQCGFKAFRTDAASHIFQYQTLDGFAFDVEALMLADRFGYSIAEVPVRWKDVSGSTVRPVHDSIHMAWDLVQIWSKVDRNLKHSPTSHLPPTGTD